jgi:hypothetical protein
MLPIGFVFLFAAQFTISIDSHIEMSNVTRIITDITLFIGETKSENLENTNQFYYSDSY